MQAPAAGLRSVRCAGQSRVWAQGPTCSLPCPEDRRLRPAAGPDGRGGDVLFIGDSQGPDLPVPQRWHRASVRSRTPRQPSLPAPQKP